MKISNYQKELQKISTIKSWIVILIISFFFFFEFGLGNAFNTLTPQILISTPNATAIDISFIASLYFYTNILGLVFAAYILDRFSPKTAIITALIACSLSIIIFANTKNLYIMGISRLIMGAGGSFCFIGCVRIATNWFSTKKLGFVIGVIISIGMLGGYASQAPVGYLLDLIGLKNTLMSISIFGFLLSILILILVENSPKELVKFRTQQTEELKKEPIIKCFKDTFKKIQNWYCGLYVGLINIGTWMLGGMWSNEYLIKTHNVNIQEARSITGYIFLGMIFAYPFWGGLTEIIKRRKLPLIIGGIGSVIIILMIMFYQVNVLELSILFFLLGFITSVQTIAYPIVGEINPMKNNAMATSIVSINSLLWGGVIAMPLFGIITTKFNQATGNESMAAPGLNFGMGILLISFIISIVFALLIKETYCKRQVE